MTDTLTVLCCVCKAHVRGPAPVAGQPVSHGYCEVHGAAAVAEAREKEG